MHTQPKATSPWFYSPRCCQAGIRAWTVAFVVVLAALLFLSYPVPPAGAQEAQETPGVKVGDGTVRVGDDAFAGDSCARTGDVVAGDCGESSETQQRNEPADDEPKDKSEEELKPDEEKPSDDNSGGTTIREETTAPDTTGGGTTLQETTGAGPTEAGTTSEDIEACPTAPPDDAAWATVERAVDGDTVELEEPVDGYDRVRLIGVNTPEMEGEDGSPESGAQEASEFTADALEGQEVVLETDEEVEDPYGRLLAYIWVVPETGESEFFNRTLVADGYAETMTVEPNDAYAECLAAAEREAGGDNSGAEEANQEDNNDGLMGRLRDLLSSDAQDDGAGIDESTASEDQYEQNGSTVGSGITELETTETVEPSEEATAVEEPDKEPAETTGGTTHETTGLTGPTPEAEDLAATPPENCPGANVVLEPFGADGDAQSDPFEVTGGTFVVRADLKSEKPADARRLDVSILDTETQEPVEEFDQRTLGSYDTLISQGPGSYLLGLQPTAGLFEVAVFDCADQELEQGSEKDPRAALDLGSSAPPATPQAPQSGGSGDQPTDQPAKTEFAVADGPATPADDAETSDVALPSQDTPSGEVPVLPDTGGPTPAAAPIVVLLTGIFAVVAGVAGLAASTGFGRNPGKRSSMDGR